MARKKPGKLTIPPDTFPERQELIVANVFIKMGEDVTFLKPSVGYKAKTPDIQLRGIYWEIKSPTGRSRHVVSDQLKQALKQSRNVIFDSSRTKLSDESIEHQLRKDITERRSLRHIILVNKKFQAIDIR